MRGIQDWVGNQECDWNFLSHEVLYFKGLGITKEDLVDGGVPVISYGQIHAKNNDGVHLRSELLRYIPRALTVGNESSRLRRGDIVFADTSEDVEGAGNCVLVDTDDEVYAGYHTLVARPRDPRNGSYLAWLFQSSAWRSQIQSRICGIKVFSITRKILKGVSVLTPSVESQKRIVAYLDEKAAAIDARVAVLEKKLAAYRRLKASVINQAVTRGLDPKVKMKDSGVDWIGKVPSGWVAGRFKDVAMVRANLVAPDLYMDYPQIAPENIEKGTGKLLGYGTVRESGIISGNHLFKKGQIIYSKIRPILNKLVIADFDGLCSADMYPIDVLGDLRFMFYQMLAPVFVNQVAAIVGMRVKMPKINQEELSAVGMVIPPLVEQRAIADYLDAECAKIDKMAELVTREIKLYRKLKRSLINEVVTGKRKVA